MVGFSCFQDAASAGRAAPFRSSVVRPSTTASLLRVTASSPYGDMAWAGGKAMTTRSRCASPDAPEPLDEEQAASGKSRAAAAATAGSGERRLRDVGIRGPYMKTIII